MNPRLAEAAKLHFEMGGPAYRFMERIGLIRNGGPSLKRRFVGFLLITWVPLLLLSLLDGKALGATPRESLLLDFATYARFFLAVPLIFMAEVVAGPRLRAAGMQFIQGGFVRPQDLPTVEDAIARVWQRREAAVPEILMLGVALLGAWNLSLEGLDGATTVTTWRQAGAGLSWAGLWYYWVAVPILQFFMYRWLWRLLIWALFLRDLARLDLDLVPTHADLAAGLGFLGGAHLSLSVFAVAASSVLSAHVAFQVYFEAVPIQSYQTPFLVYLVLMELLCFGPLLLFLPKLAKARREGLRRYSLLLNRYNRAFDDKWVSGRADPVDEPLLGSGDIQSLADLGNSFAMIRDMKPFPFSQLQVIQIAVISSLPGLPLIFLVMPIGELLNLLAGALL